MKQPLFDSWTQKYDRWFETATGQFVKKYEAAILLDLLKPQSGELILDAGCGTEIFTRDIIDRGSKVIGMDLSAPMVAKGAEQMADMDFNGICGDMCALPFSDNRFDKVFSMTAIEFIPDAAQAIDELNRVVKKGGTIVVTTLNSLSPWAEHRIQKAEEVHYLFQNIIFRSPEDMSALVPKEHVMKTAIHFQKSEPTQNIARIEEEGRKKHLNTGAFLARQWIKK